MLAVFDDVGDHGVAGTIEGSIYMIELAFGESPAGALKLAKSMKQGERLVGAVACVWRHQRRTA